MGMKSRWISLGLSLLGVGGVWGTSWLAIRCHEKAKNVEGKKEKLIAYAPAIASGVATSGAILGSHYISRKEIVTLAASCAYLAANRDKIEKKARELLGDKKVNAIKGEAAMEARKALPDRPRIEETGYGRTHFVETMFGREFYCSLEHIDWVKKKINELFMSGQSVNYNTFYELVGLKKSRVGWDYGWPSNNDLFGYSVDEPIYIEIIDVTDDESGERCYLLDVRSTPPVQGYLEMEG